jgi:hypothetical protein
MTRRRSDAEVGSASADLTPDDANDGLLEALRNLWPILSPNGRQKAIDTVNSLKESGD